IVCATALRELGATMNWNVVFETAPLERDLQNVSVDLNLEDQDPRMVAQLIAVAGGADCIFDDPADYEGARTTLHVVRVPSPETESGRRRLRAMAGQWYRSFLRDELQNEPLVQEQGIEVRMHLGRMLIENGDLESAIAFFSDVYDRRPHDQAAAAILRIAECHLDLADGHLDRESKRKDYAAAESWVRRIFESMPMVPEVAQATILLGRALLGQARAEIDPAVVREKARACQEELRARIIRLLDSVELIEVQLLAGRAQFLMDRPDKVYETMVNLRGSPYFEELEPKQYLDYHFLLGYGALGEGKMELAMRALEWFLIHAEGDERRGQAYVLLAEAYLAQKRFMEARAAAIEARTRHLSPMNSAWRERTLRVWAKTALALGEKEDAFLELEQMVLRGEEPELTLFLVDELLADRQWQRAISIARMLRERDDEVGDQARYKTVLALYEQATAGDNLEAFPSQAIAIAPNIKSRELRERVATIIGDAYTKLNKLEHAADAYRGILR
ncbi:MAG TPA: hypothetical protein ENI87_13730, partial [bacterium]|nr:hypothetical protein [bacterium]